MFLRLSWVKSFYIGYDGKKDETWKVYITHSHDEKPSMDELKEIFGDNIDCFVDFIEERVKNDDDDDDDNDEELGFLRGPRPGDAL